MRFRATLVNKSRIYYMTENIQKRKCHDHELEKARDSDSWSRLGLYTCLMLNKTEEKET